MSHRFLSCLFAASLLAGPLAAPLFAQQAKQKTDPPPADTSAGDALVSEYFRLQTEKLAAASLADIQTLEDWQQHREEYRRQLQEMLGLDPMPQRTDLQATITGVVKDHGIVVEKLHFQSMPGLYVTASLYRPEQVDEPLPTILYVCGHGRVVKDGVSLGNKATYQHHGAWFARNGYVCLIIDTIQLGEIEGQHHGTYRYGKWWWNNRGYTPAGVEAWNGIRALDYLETRPEVDAKRFGVTGRSGGGAYSWWVAALDQRIAAAVPVAGITSLHNHVVDGCVEGHCDCMYMVNTYRWDFGQVAALVAPRPLLISNTDKDRIFPLEGVVDVHAQTRRIYRLHDAGAALGLQITEGPHKDTQELHIHAFRWFNRHLRGTDELIEIAAHKLFDPESLKVFDSIPEDERVTTIDQSFVPAVSPEDLPNSSAQLAELRSQWRRQLDAQTFRGWPGEDEQEPLEVKRVADQSVDGVRVQRWEFTSETPYRLPVYLLQAAGEATTSPADIDVTVLGQAEWEQLAPALAAALPEADSLGKADATAWQTLVQRLQAEPQRAIAYVAPRGVGPTQWTTEERAQTHIRRRFMLLGQTDDGMRVWDVRRAVQALAKADGLAGAALHLHGEGNAAAIALYAAVYEDAVKSLRLTEPPVRNRDGLSLLNVSKFLEMPQLVLLVASGGKQVTITSAAEQRPAWQPLVGDGKAGGALAKGITLEALQR